MSKWKLEIKAPFGGYCLDWYKDTNNIYGSSNEANDMKTIDMSALSYIRQGYTQKTLENNSQLDTFFHGNTTGECIVSSSNEILYLYDIDADYEKFYPFGGMPLSLGSTSVHRTNVPQFNTARIGSYWYTFYTKSSGNGDIARSGGFDKIPSIDVDWGSTVPTGKAELQPHYDNIYCISRYKSGIAFGNSNYLGKLSDTLTLTPQYIYYGFSEYVFDIETLNNYLYVATCNNGNKNNITKTTIHIYNANLESDTELDSFVLNGRISAMIVFNNRLYAFYRYSNSTDNWVGVLNGNQFQDIKKFDGELPNPLQMDVYNNGLVWHNGTNVYHLFQATPNGQYIIERPFITKYSTINGIMAYNNKLIVGSTNGTLFDASVYTARSVDCYWTSIAHIVSDANHLSMIDAIEVTTNKLASGARCDLTILPNQNTSLNKTFTINTVGSTRHVFRNVDIQSISEFQIKLDWTNGSTTNLCDVKRIIIYGHTVSR